MSEFLKRLAEGAAAKDMTANLGDLAAALESAFPVADQCQKLISEASLARLPSAFEATAVIFAVAQSLRGWAYKGVRQLPDDSPVRKLWDLMEKAFAADEEELAEMVRKAKEGE